MKISEYRDLDATAIDELVSSGEVTAKEIAEVALKCNEQNNPNTKAVVEWYEDPTPMVTETDSRRPTLMGVPFLRKDYGSAERGRLVEMGSRLAQGNRAQHSAPFIARIQAAGAQIMGRSAVPEFIQHGVTSSRVNGVTRNPWGIEKSAGGSSGGAAAAVGSCVVPIAHASDCAGSIRIPAATCGLLGLKPGRGRVPWPDGGWDGIAQEFVITRSVRDARRCLSIVGDGPTPPGPRQLRIAISTSHWAGGRLEPGLAEATQQMASVIESLGHIVEPIAPPLDYDQVIETWPSCFSRFALLDVEALLAHKTPRMNQLDLGRVMSSEEWLEPMTRAAIERADALSDDDIAWGREQRSRVETRLNTDLAGFDAIINPTLARTSLPVEGLDGEVVDPEEYARANDEVFPFNYVFNLAGWASISIPGQRGPRFPIGSQISSRPGTEALLLDLAEAIERVQPWEKSPWHVRTD